MYRTMVKIMPAILLHQNKITPNHQMMKLHEMGHHLTVRGNNMVEEHPVIEGHPTVEEHHVVEGHHVIVEEEILVLH